MENSIISRLLKEKLLTRTLTATLIAPLVLFIIYKGENYFHSLVILAALIIGLEWSNVVSSSQTKSRKLIWNCVGLLYIGPSLISLIYIRNLPQGMENIFWLFLVVWASDIGAYISGITFRGPKLAPSISPSKTWSGFIGAITLATLVSMVFSIFTVNHEFSYMKFAPLIATSSQIGDLIESAWKRHFNVKDSGTLLPGHGGILDRVDGLILASTVLCLVVLK